MVDTIRVQYQGINWSPRFADWLRERYPTAEYHERFYDVNLPWQGMTLTDESLGTIGLKSNRRGNYLWFERSVPKFMYGENCRVLSQEEAQEGITGLLSGVETLFQDWWEFPAPRAAATVQRVDVCYQQRVPSSTEVFAQLVRSLNIRRVTQHGTAVDALPGVMPVSVHLMGIELHQSRLEHARWYDKGQESGDERYLDVVRHEEQLRRGKAGWLIEVPADGSRVVLHEDAARLVMNRRYRQSSMECFNVGTLLEQGKAGALAALLVLAPDYDSVVRRHCSNGTYYNARKMALDAQAARVSVDLAVPEGAWREPMVL